ncbi:MAG: metal ABC transporter permease [bacterium]|nr:metal ABC transporter permease [bacterium]
MTAISGWILITGFLAAGAAGLLGTLLVLRKLSLIGDAISHAVLPGIVLAFLLSGSRDPFIMLIGAGAVGLLTTIFIEWLHKRGVAEDASTGIVFSALFAFGVLLVSLFSGNIDLDADCVLYGELALVPLAQDFPPGSGIPRPTFILGVVYLVNLLLLGLLYKEWKITTFDAALATSFGFSAGLLHYLLMGAVSLTTVASFEATGAILVVAMFIAPAASAVLLFQRLSFVFVWTQVFALLTTGLGYLLARALDGSIAGAMSTVAGILFTLTLVFAPERGILAKLYSKRRLHRRIALEDLIGLLYRLEEKGEGARGHALEASLVSRAKHAGLVEQTSHGWMLTANGKQVGHSLVRSHRLWESFLETEFQLPADHTHATADEVEHFLSAADRSVLERLLSFRTIDPQGKPIPKE